MAKFNKISESEAPRPARQSGRLALRMRLYEEFVGSLKHKEVGKVSPEEGETARGIALRIGRAARRVGKTSETWVVDNIVYVKVA
jgi:hypothetical protein